MADVVVTVPKPLWADWLAEGDLATDVDPNPWEGDYEYGFTMGGAPPSIRPGERVYIVAHGMLRGYAPLAYLDTYGGPRFGGRPGTFALVRRGGAVACTIPSRVRGFQGWRYPWWPRGAEIPFPEWRTLGVR